MTLKFKHSGPNSYLWIVERNNGGVVEVVAQVGVEEVARETQAPENHEGPDHPLLAPENILASSTAAQLSTGFNYMKKTHYCFVCELNRLTFMYSLPSNVLPSMKTSVPTEHFKEAHNCF